MPIQQSVSIPILPQNAMPLEQLLNEIAAIGFPAIEIWERGDDFVELCQLAANCGLHLISMIGHKSLRDGLNNAANHDRIEAELRESVDLAVTHGQRALVCFSGNHIPGMSEEEAIANTVAGLRRGRALRRSQWHPPPAGASKLQSRPPRLSVRSQRLGSVSAAAGGKRQRQAALRHLSHADHGRGCPAHHHSQSGRHRPSAHGRQPWPQ